MAKVTAAAAALLGAVVDGVKQAGSAGEEKKDSPPDPSVKAIEDLRSAAKWILAAFATVGALFGAGVQLTGVGDLPATASSGRSVSAAVGYLLVVAGIVMAIAGTAHVLRRGNLTLDDVLQVKHLKSVRDNHAVAEPWGSVQALKNRLDALRDEMLIGEKNVNGANAALEELPALDEHASRKDKARTDRAEQNVRVAVARMNELTAEYDMAHAARRRTLSSGALAHVRHHFNVATFFVFLGAVLTSLGLLGFVWGANPPDPGKLAAPPVLPQTPTAVKFLLTADGQKEYADELGESCPLDTALEGIAMSVSGDVYTVASKQTDLCTSSWLVLSPKRARVALADKEEPAAAGTKASGSSTTVTPSGSGTTSKTSRTPTGAADTPTR